MLRLFILHVWPPYIRVEPTAVSKACFLMLFDSSHLRISLMFQKLLHALVTLLHNSLSSLFSNEISWPKFICNFQHILIVYRWDKYRYFSRVRFVCIESYFHTFQIKIICIFSSFYRHLFSILCRFGFIHDNCGNFIIIVNNVFFTVLFILFLKFAFILFLNCFFSLSKTVFLFVK